MKLLIGRKIEDVQIYAGGDSLVLMLDGGEKFMVSANRGDIRDPLSFRVSKSKAEKPLNQD